MSGGASEMKEIELKNGSMELNILVNAIMLSLRKLFDEFPLALYDLIEKCKDREYQIFGSNVERLKRLSLISEENHQIHGSIRNIVLSAIEGDGMDMTLVSPVKPKGEKEAKA